MKKNLTKIVVCLTLVSLCALACAGCYFLVPRPNENELHQIPVTTKAFFTKCIDEDADLLVDKLGEEDYVLIKDYRQFIVFFDGHDYSEYSHLLMCYKDFNFFDFNMIILRTEPLKKSRSINIMGWFNGTVMSSSDQGEGMHYYIALLEKSETTLIIV